MRIVVERAQTNLDIVVERELLARFAEWFAGLQNVDEYLNYASRHHGQEKFFTL